RSPAIGRSWAMPRRPCCGWSPATSTARIRDRRRPRAGPRRCRPRSDLVSVRLDHGEDGLADIHEINVTPFIDVMLVLLIIFMVEEAPPPPCSARWRLSRTA